MRRAILFALLLTELFLSSKTALANIAAIRSDPGVVGAPALGVGESRSRPVGLHVAAERLAFECREEDTQPVCDFRVTYQVRSSAREPQSIVAAFMGIHTSGVQVRVNGRTVSHVLTATQAKHIDRAVRAEIDRESGIHLDSGYLRLSDGLTRDGFSMTIESGQEVRIEATGRVRPGRRVVPSYAVDPVHMRHHILGTRAAVPEFDLAYLVAPIRTWGSVGAIHVSIRYPATWLVGVAVDDKTDMPAVKDRIERSTRTVEMDLNSAADLLRLHITLPARVFRNGGVLLGIGGTVDQPRGLRARLGYEVAAPGWLFHGITMDTDFSEELVVTPTLEAATSGLFFVIPSLAVGLGVPIRVAPEATAGVRMQLTLQWPFVGFVTSVDLYPALASDDPGFMQTTILAQIAL